MPNAKEIDVVELAEFGIDPEEVKINYPTLNSDDEIPGDFEPEELLDVEEE